MGLVAWIWAVSAVFFVFLTMVNSETVEVRRALVQFMHNMFPGNESSNWGWNLTSDPCIDGWKGVDCSGSQSVKKIVLDQFNLTGVFDPNFLCVARSLQVISLSDNNFNGELPEQISNCNHLTHLYLQGNNFSGNVPSSLQKLSNLKRINISSNHFSGKLPDLSRITSLLTFRVENNKLSGGIPKLDFSNLRDFNVSNNNFTGPIPEEINGHFSADSFIGNPRLCGAPLSNPCPAAANPTPSSKDSSRKQYFIYSGYAVLAFIIILLLLFKASKIRKKPKQQTDNNNGSSKSISSVTSEFKNGGSRSEYSITSSPDTGKTSASLAVLSSPVMISELKFEDLLRAPAELIGRGKNGTLYKVTLNSGMNLAVKRIKDWEISKDEFKKRMQSLNKVKHQNVSPVVAYYCSQQEKLLVYEFQQNGSLFNLLHGSQNGKMFDWRSRLSVAANTANALAFMHQKLQNDGIAHGNLKSSNIFLNKDMDPCISEYGLMAIENQDQQETILSNASNQDDKTNVFKFDVYAFGVILLELLTGKMFIHCYRGSQLANWVESAVREEWTVEVFDKALILEGASEEMMINLLQIALRCINPLPNARPSMNEVTEMIISIKEDDEKSLIYSA